MRSDAKNKLQTTQKRKKQKPKRGFKLSPRDLAEWIRLANLMPPGTAIPIPGIRKPSGAEDYWSIVLEWIARLPDSLREELLSLDDYPRIEHDAARQGFLRAVCVLQHAQKIDIASTCLRALTKPDSERTMDYLEDFLNTLRYVELPYLRQCGVCNQLFYAKRKTQSGCTTHHSTILYKREQYAKKRDKAARDKANRELKKRRGEK